MLLSGQWIFTVDGCKKCGVINDLAPAGLHRSVMSMFANCKNLLASLLQSCSRDVFRHIRGLFHLFVLNLQVQSETT